MLLDSARVVTDPIGLPETSSTLETIRRNLSTTYKGLEEQDSEFLGLLARFLYALHIGLRGRVAAICAASGLSANRVREALLGLRGMTVATLLILLCAVPSVVTLALSVALRPVGYEIRRRESGATLTLGEALATITESCAAISAALTRAYLDRTPLADARRLTLVRDIDRCERALADARIFSEAA